MTNTTFNDCPSVPRKKGRADPLSTRTNMAKTTFNDENTFTGRIYSPRKPTWPTLPSMTRTHSAFRATTRRHWRMWGNAWPLLSLEKSTIRLFFAVVVSRNLPKMRLIHSWLSNMEGESDWAWFGRRSNLHTDTKVWGIYHHQSKVDEDPWWDCSWDEESALLPSESFSVRVPYQVNSTWW
jgi:hypothetical protein